MSGSALTDDDKMTEKYLPTP